MPFLKFFGSTSSYLLFLLWILHNPLGFPHAHDFEGTHVVVSFGLSRPVIHLGAHHPIRVRQLNHVKTGYGATGRGPNDFDKCSVVIWHFQVRSLPFYVRLLPFYSFHWHLSSLICVFSTWSAVLFFIRFVLFANYVFSKQMICVC